MYSLLAVPDVASAASRYSTFKPATGGDFCIPLPADADTVQTLKFAPNRKTMFAAGGWDNKVGRGGAPARLSTRVSGLGDSS
jgi:hypothetical protein